MDASVACCDDDGRFAPEEEEGEEVCNQAMQSAGIGRRICGRDVPPRLTSSMFL